MEGYKTTEFWLNIVASLLAAGLPLLVFYGVVTEEEAGMWQALIMALAAAIVSVALIWGAKAYANNRTALKQTALETAAYMSEDKQ